METRYLQLTARLGAWVMLAVAGANCGAASQAGAGSPNLEYAGGAQGRLAFVEKGVLFMVNAEGGEASQVVNLGNDQRVSSPSWEADDSSLVFTVQVPDTPPQLWMIRVGGRIPYQILQDGAYGAYDPAFAPDGRSVVFSRCRARDGACDLFGGHRWNRIARDHAIPGGRAGYVARLVAGWIHRGDCPGNGGKGRYLPDQRRRLQVAPTNARGNRRGSS